MGEKNTFKATRCKSYQKHNLPSDADKTIEKSTSVSRAWVPGTHSTDGSLSDYGCNPPALVDGPPPVPSTSLQCSAIFFLDSDFK